MVSGNSFKELPLRKERFFYESSTYRIVAIVFFLGIFLLLNYFPYSSGINVNQTSQPRAAVVDQLSISQPNQTFVLTATNLLEEAGYTVNYYPGEEVTIDFFKNLPAFDYDLIIMRVHMATRFGEPGSPIALFTSEPYIDLLKKGLRFTSVGTVSYQQTTPISPQFTCFRTWSMKNEQSGML